MVKTVIGGDGATVEVRVDKTDIGRRMHNCGCIIDGQCVFGGIDRETGNFLHGTGRGQVKGYPATTYPRDDRCRDPHRLRLLESV